MVAVCDVNEGLANTTARLWKVPEYYSSLSRLLERGGVDVIDICAPPQMHATLAVQAMESKCNVLIEKPLTMTTTEADDIVNCQKITGLKVGVIHNWLYEPPMVKATSMLEKGDLGEVLSVDIAAISTKDDSMAANEHHWSHRLPGGRFTEMLPHPVYILQRFLGNLEVKGVWTSKLGSSYSWMKADELYAILGTDQKWGRVYVSFNAPRDAIFVTIYGSKAILRSDIIGASIVKLPAMVSRTFEKGFDSLRQASQLVGLVASDTLRVLTGHWRSGHDTYIQLFAESVLKDKDTPVSLTEAYEAVKVTQQIFNLLAS